ncbi:MAG: hypothetical protein H7Y38_11555 [Armatimonadetes bacterium]|nr:hypothetical protein [Armatimonadota bacterium]
MSVSTTRLTTAMFIALAFTGVCVRSATAQFTQSGTAYYTTADYTLNTDVSGSEVFVGKNTDFSDVPGSITLTVATGAVTTFSPGGTNGFAGVAVFGNHNIAIGGSNTVFRTGGYDTSTTAISGGAVTYATGFGTSITNITGGNVFDVTGFDNSVVNINNTTSVGGIDFATGFDSSRFRVSGGRLANGIILNSTGSTLDIVGTGLGYTYGEYGFVPAYNRFADRFQVTGTVGGELQTYDVFLQNPLGMGGIANNVPRQFTFNGAAPTAAVVPETGTFALLLPGIVLGAAVIRRKK